MSPAIRYSHNAVWCKARGPERRRAHVHECIGPGHGYDEHLCACGAWFKAAAQVETREVRVPDSARTGAHEEPA